MKLFLSVISLFILNACFVLKKADKGSIIHFGTKLIQDTTIHRELISKNKLDTSHLLLGYQYYTHPVEAWQDSVNRLVTDFIYSTTHYEKPVDLVLVASDSLFISCINSFVQQATKDYHENEFGSLWQYETRTSISDLYQNFVLFNCGTYVYSGGAHGYSYYDHIKISKKNGKRLVLKDFISDTIEFRQIAEMCFRKQNKISQEENLSDLGFWFQNDVFYCNDNFYTTDEAFYFIYNSYEIAPYAMGLFEFNVPFELCQHLIKIDLSKK